jgi:ubiquinone/menaquinone biosynthesis C-methylase UbiE
VKAYYEARAEEYDDWWVGAGLFEQRDRPGWESERESLFGTLAALQPVPTLDVACGTGYLTRYLPGRITCLDQSAAMLEVASTRIPAARFVQGDALPLPFADHSFGRVFTSHFYGHLEEDDRVAFLAEARRVGHELVIVDSALREDVEPVEWQERVLNDGSRWTVYTRYFTPEALLDELGGRILLAGRWWVAVVA